MSYERILLTPSGEQQLRGELKNRMEERRPTIVKAIAEARAHGDLSENAEYHAAREEQGLNEARIRYLESRLAVAEIIDPSRFTQSPRVRFGMSVTIESTDNETQSTYMLVGQDEVEPDKGRISWQSPIASAVIGKEVGDVVVARTPKGDAEFEIVSVGVAEA